MKISPRESPSLSTHHAHRIDRNAVVGVLATLVIHGGAIGLTIFLNGASFAHMPAEDLDYVVARLVRRGKKRDPKTLPQRTVAPPRPAPAKKVVSPEAPAAKTRREQTHATDTQETKHSATSDDSATKQTDLRRAFDKAALLERAQEEIEAEGDPNGVDDGDANEASAGDEYITRIADIWRRTWSLPAIIPADEAKALYVLVTLRIDATGGIRLPISIDRASGNAYFDESIRAAWARIQKLPLPPADKLKPMMAQGLALKLTWKGLQ